MIVQHFGCKQNKNTGVWYRILYHFRIKEYYVQTLGEHPLFQYEGCWIWIILCPFKNLKDAEEMLNALLKIKSWNI